MIDHWVEWSDGLSEDEAIVIGLWNNPAYQELLADLRIAQADVIQAAQVLNPRVTTMLPLGPKQWELALQVPIDVLWLRPIRVSAAELESHRVAERLVQDGLNAIRDVRVAYIDWQLAIERAELTERGAQLRQDVARIAEARLAAGDVAELDVTAIRVDALSVKGDALRAARAADLAREQLRYVLGLQLADYELHPSPPTDLPQTFEFDIEHLVADAVSSRPDLRAVQLAASAAQERAELARKSIWQLTGLLPDINARGRKGFEAGPGLQFDIPIFHQNQGEILQAQADAERLCRQYVNRRDLAALEVRQAHIRMEQALQDLRVWRKALPQAEDAVTSTEQALQENTVSLLLVLETTRQLLALQLREREAVAQLRRAIAELERSVGHRIIDDAAIRPSDIEVLPSPQVELGDYTP